MVDGCLAPTTSGDRLVKSNRLSVNTSHLCVLQRRGSGWRCLEVFFTESLPIRNRRVYFPNNFLEQLMSFGFWSLLPMLVALILAFTTRSAVLSLLAGIVVGAFMIGGNTAIELNELFQRSLGTKEFIWVCEIVILIGVMTEMLKRSGVIDAFAQKLSGLASSPRSVKVTTWAMGLLIVDDYFSPLLSGTVMRPLSDRAVIPREKLAFILDATTASVCVLVPFLSWGAFIVSLIVAQGGPITSTSQGMEVFIQSLPYNFYSIILVFFTLGIALQWIPDYGPMLHAEKRALATGLLLREGASPLMDDSESVPFDITNSRPNLVAHLLIPVGLVLGTAVGGYALYDAVLIAEAFLISTFYLTMVLLLQRQIRGASELSKIILSGIQSVLPALLIVALAYSLNAVTESLGASEWIVESTKGLVGPKSLVALTFLIAALISFATGTSWGTFALVMPLALPLAYSFSGGEISPLVVKTIAAVTGGGIFGDHVSPLSDTSVLSSTGAGSDHMDHVITQLPYALTVGAITIVLYFLI